MGGHKPGISHEQETWFEMVHVTNNYDVYAGKLNPVCGTFFRGRGEMPIFTTNYRGTN